MDDQTRHHAPLACASTDPSHTLDHETIGRLSKALTVLLGHHSPVKVDFGTGYLCADCAGSPEWPCAAVQIIQEALDVH